MTFFSILAKSQFDAKQQCKLPFSDTFATDFFY